MDFITKLPRIRSRHDAIWVVVDRLTKSAHFLAIREDYSTEKLARLYTDEIVVRHGVHVLIILDRDARSLKRSRIPLVKASWNSKRGPKFTWEREEYMKFKYPQLFVDRAVVPTS
ncbi:putative reverse transcriptase domain-containing protein [Tanacetum coccineum]